MEEQEKREKLLGEVREGWKSEYWIILRDKVKEWIADEEAYLDTFKSRGMSDRHLETYNRSRDNIDFMRKFLNINQNIIAENETFLARLKSGATTAYRKVQTFVTK